MPILSSIRKLARVLLPPRRACTRLVLSLLVGGCAAFQPAPEDAPALHVLDAKPVVAAATENSDLVLEVSAPKAWPGFDTSRIAYVRQAHVLDYYARNRWADAPARMLAPLLVRALEQTGSFRAVVQPPAAVGIDLRLVTELARLQQDFTAKPSRVELALHVQLLDVRGRRVLATRTFEATENASSEDAYGGVTAANIALARVLGQVAAFCVAEGGRVHPPAPGSR